MGGVALEGKLIEDVYQGEDCKGSRGQAVETSIKVRTREGAL